MCFARKNSPRKQSKCMPNKSLTIDTIIFFHYIFLTQIRRWVEQLAARRAHNPEAAGSSPAPAKEEALSLT